MPRRTSPLLQALKEIDFFGKVRLEQRGAGVAWMLTCLTQAVKVRPCAVSAIAAEHLTPSSAFGARPHPDHPCKIRAHMLS
jgi:hypothetical protein